MSDKKNLGARKYDRNELWKDFLASKYLQVTPWARARGYLDAKGRVRREVAGLTVGWTKRKSDFKQDVAEEVQEKFGEELARNYEEALKSASGAEVHLIKTIARKVIHESDNVKPEKMADLIAMGQFLRLVTGKATERTSTLTPEEESKIEEVLKKEGL